MAKTLYTIYHHLNNPYLKELEKKLISLLDKHNFEYNSKKNDLIIVLGGDGSLLHIANEKNYEKEFILINCGHLGYYSDYSDEEFISFLENDEIKSQIIEEIPCYKLETNNKEYYFVNDAYIFEDKPLDFDLLINGKKLSTTKANGIIIGSGVGSSGYLSSLNSPVIFDTKSIYQYSFISAIKNKMTSTFIEKGVLNINDILEIKTNIDSDLSIDGIKIGKIKSFKISKSNKKFRLIHFKEINNFDRIKKTFC